MQYTIYTNTRGYTKTIDVILGDTVDILIQNIPNKTGTPFKWGWTFAPKTEGYTAIESYLAQESLGTEKGNYQSEEGVLANNTTNSILLSIPIINDGIKKVGTSYYFTFQLTNTDQNNADDEVVQIIMHIKQEGVPNSLDSFKKQLNYTLNLNDLDNVSITNVQNGDFLVFSTTLNKFVNAPFVVNVDNLVTSVNGQTGVVVLGKNDVGLGNVPNIDATNRTNHTGQQDISTITNLQSNLDSKQPVGNYALSGDNTDISSLQNTLLTVTNATSVKAKSFQNFVVAHTPTTTTLNLDFSTSSDKTINTASLTGNLTLTFTNVVANTPYKIFVTQGATPRNITFPTPTVSTLGGNVFDGYANCTQMFEVYYTGSQYLISSGILL